MTTPVSTTIYASRDAIRTQVIDYLQQYMELNEIDLSQSSFLSYIVDIITTLSSNLMFYQSNIYKEFFLTQAQLPESIHNLSSFLGYSPSEAQYASANILMTVNLPFSNPNTEFTIDDGFTFETGDGVAFITYSKATVTVTGNTAVSIVAEQSEKLYDIPVNVDTTSEQSVFQFILPVRQYKTTVQEFTLDEDLQPFQFSDINVPIEGKVSDLTVKVIDPDDTTSNGTTYTEFDSLSLMDDQDYGYVMRVSSDGRKLYFGNGIMGQQPLAGSNIVVTINETEGADGNVVSGTIVNGERIYSTQSGETSIIDYSATNPAPGYNGTDEEDLQQIRSNSIQNIVSLSRLVSEGDYNNFDVVVPDSPIRSNSTPILKRSDLKINEVQVFTILEFDNDIVPSKNVSYEIPSTTTYVARDEVIEKDGIDYITLFEMTIDSINEAAYYHYIMREIELAPTLIQSWSGLDGIYHFHANNVVITADDSAATAIFELSYYSNETDFADCECELEILSSNETFSMTNVPGTAGGTFTYEFADYLDIPKDLETFYFNVTNPQTTSIQESNSKYSISVTFRKDLKSYMISNTVDDGATTIIYDVPVILKSYYDGIDKVVFETQVLQDFMSANELKNYRMLTDFVNLKLCNTTGSTTNMLLNKTNQSAVVDIGLTSIPTGTLNDRYIVSGNEGMDWNDNKDKIATCTNASAQTYEFSDPKDSDVVYITNKDSNYIYSELGWKVPIYDIPLQIKLEVFKINDTSINETSLKNDIKTVIIDYYTDSFGSNLDIRRSKIVDLVHNVTGVSHCRLIKPETSIFFNYDIDTFTQQQLLDFTPDWIYFAEDDITINIFTLDN